MTRGREIITEVEDGQRWKYDVTACNFSIETNASHGQQQPTVTR